MDVVYELKRVCGWRVRNAEHANERAGDECARGSGGWERPDGGPSACDGGTQRLSRTTAHGERRGDKGDRLGVRHGWWLVLSQDHAAHLHMRRRSSSRYLSGPSGEPQAAVVKRVFEVVDSALLPLALDVVKLKATITSAEPGLRLRHNSHDVILVGTSSLIATACTGGLASDAPVCGLRAARLQRVCACGPWGPVARRGARRHAPRRMRTGGATSAVGARVSRDATTVVPLVRVDPAALGLGLSGATRQWCRVLRRDAHARSLGVPVGCSCWGAALPRHLKRQKHVFLVFTPRSFPASRVHVINV